MRFLARVGGASHVAVAAHAPWAGWVLPLLVTNAKLTDQHIHMLGMAREAQWRDGKSRPSSQMSQLVWVCSGGGGRMAAGGAMMCLVLASSVCVSKTTHNAAFMFYIARMDIWQGGRGSCTVDV